MRPLNVVVGKYPHTSSLFGGQETASTTVEDLSLRFRTLQDEPGAFARMANDAEFDICEMPIVSYLVARDRGARITALPIYLTRGFDHRRLVRGVSSGISEPRDLMGRAVGVRYYGFTDGTWARVALAETYGVDLDRITWVTNTPETVPSAPLPRNVQYVPDADLISMTEGGDLAAVILNFGQDVVSENLAPLFPDPEATERAWLESTGVYPIHHVVVAQDDLLRELPTLPSLLMQVFGAAKKRLLDRLASESPLSDEELALASTRDFMGVDPLPYGVAENRAVIEMIIRASFAQHLVHTPAELEDAFPIA